jgi:hypothetical protein
MYYQCAILTKDKEATARNWQLLFIYNQDFKYWELNIQASYVPLWHGVWCLGTGADMPIRLIVCSLK